MIIIFVHLHNHTCYSLLDSISQPEEIIKRIKELNQNAIAITDHGNTYASVKMYKLCKKENIKFIYGCECYICDNIRIKDKNNKYYHIVLLATNEIGRLNLNKLVSIADIEGKYYKPRIDFELLKKYKEGIIVLSACMAGEIQRSLQNKNKKNAKQIALKYKKEFGDNYYLEIQSHSDAQQLSLARQVVDLAKELNIQYVVTADSHYLTKKDQKLHSVFVQISQDRDVGESYTDCYIQSEDDIRNILKNTLTEEEINTAINNTIKIANQCNVKIPLSLPQIPHVEIPNNYKNEEEYLKYLCNKGWINRGINKLPKKRQDIYKRRLLYEFNAIKEMGFIGYYLLVHSYANIARRRGIARGSGGGSLVAYLINIVDIDPIEYGLYFERFIDVSALDLLKTGEIKPEEVKIPDFDLDFGEKDREKVLDFIVNKYGKNNVAAIGNFQYMWDRSAIKDIGRVLGIPYDITNEITKIIGEGTIQETIEDGLLDKYIKQYPLLFSYAKQLAGLPKSFSMHPCGKIVSIKELTYYTSIANNNGNIVYQADMHDIEDLGLVKIDTLGLRTVDVIYDVLDMINEDYDYINPKKINFNDKKVLQEFRNGNTYGIFQFESTGMQQVLKKMQVSSLNDIIVANALYRPGSKDYIDNYVDRKHGRETFEYLHPDLEEILETTYGIIVFQEQLIEIGRLAGMKNPDLLRKATGKKNPKLMAKAEPEFKSGLKNRGWEESQIDKLWNDMLKFSRYSFNKSHSAAYAIIAYIVGKLKTYHPKEFICALFNSYHGKHEKMTGCFDEAIRLNVKIEPLSIKNSSPLCKIKNNKLYYGVSLIKHCNKKIAEELYRLGKNNYDSFLDLLIDIKETSVRNNQLSILTKLNFFSEFGNNKKLLDYIDIFNKYYGKKQFNKDKMDSQLEDVIKLFCNKETPKQYREFDSYKFLRYMWKQIPNEILPLNEQLDAEKEYLGYCQTTIPESKYDLGYVLEVNTKYTPRLLIYDITDGSTQWYKIKKSTYNKSPIEESDIIYIAKTEQKNKMRKINNQWVKLDELEWHITDYIKTDPNKLTNYIKKIQ